MFYSLVEIARKKFVEDFLLNGHARVQVIVMLTIDLCLVIKKVTQNKKYFLCFQIEALINKSKRRMKIKQRKSKVTLVYCSF